jgi:hypothetical protein
MRVLACLLALFVLAACAGDRERHISSPVAARFADEAASAPEIEITATDRQPVETAELIAPDGTAIPAHQIDRSKTVEETRGGDPSVGVGVFGGSSGHIGTSVGIGFPLFGDGSSRDPVIDSRALIRIPDMAAYRAGWQQYRLRLRFGAAPENERVMEIPAPRPPEG